MKKTLTTLFVLVWLTSFSAPVNSMLGAFETKLIEGDDIPENPTAADYIQDGLIALWDGIENYDWGVNVQGSRTWYDLINGYELNKQINSSVYFVTSEDAFVLNQGYARVSNNETVSSVDGSLFDSYNAGDSTIEVICGDCINQCGPSFIASATGSVWGKGAISYGTYGSSYPQTIFIRSYNGTYRPNPIVEYSCGPDVWWHSVTMVENGYLRGWFDGVELEYSTQPIASDVQCARFVINRAVAYRAIRIYNRALTEDELRHNRIIDKIRFNLQ